MRQTVETLHLSDHVSLQLALLVCSAFQLNITNRIKLLLSNTVKLCFLFNGMVRLVACFSSSLICSAVVVRCSCCLVSCYRKSIVCQHAVFRLKQLPLYHRDNQDINTVTEPKCPLSSCSQNIQHPFRPGQYIDIINIMM